MEAEASATVIEPNVFNCKFCTKKFSNSKALGGHQIAHKRERNLERRAQEQRIMAHGQAYRYPHTYSSMHSIPLHGSLSRPLGVQVQSMICKPYYPWSLARARYGHGGWTIPGINPQPIIDYRGGNRGLHGTQVLRFNDGGAMARVAGVMMGATVSNAAVNMIDADVGDHPLGGSHLETHQKEEEELDLTLKL